ncbi:MAG: methylene-tetrahydromethanopterin dehydrogenase N-terminal domain-containing protein, partial [Candidatus Altiarchaeota archaeon]
MKRVLVYMTPERHCSLFDLIVAHDAGADVVIPYNNVGLQDVSDIVYGCCFTRHPKDLINTGIFIGGYNSEKAEGLASEALNVLENLPKEMKVNIAIDPNGAYTTASACVSKIKSSIVLKDASVVVLAGTGPVGISTARLLLGLGAKVKVTSRSRERAEAVAGMLKSKDASGFQINNAKKVAEAVRNADVVVSTGPPGVELMSKSA